MRTIRKDPIKISFTGWKRYTQTCPQQHFLIMTGQRPSFVDGRNFARGNILHKMMEDYMTTEGLTSDWIPANLESYWRDFVDNNYILWKSDTDEKEMFEKALEWAHLLGQKMDKLNLDRNTCRTELNIRREFEVDGYTVRMNGKIDLLIPLAAGSWMVLDYKMSASKSAIDPWQSVFYSLLLDDYEDNAKFVEWAAFMLPSYEDLFVYNITQDQRDWLLQSIRQMARDVISDKFDPDPDDSKCFKCDVSKVCPVRGGAVPVGTGRMTI